MGSSQQAMSYAANLQSNTRFALINSSKKLALVSAFVACSAPRGLGFIPAARHGTFSAQQGLRRRWSSAAAPAARHISGSSAAGSGGRDKLASRYIGSTSSVSGRRRRRKRERLSMSGEGAEGAEGSVADGRLGPGKGTQVVLLRHGMSTFNKLNIFTVSGKDLDGWTVWCFCVFPAARTISSGAALAIHRKRLSLLPSVEPEA